MIDDNLHARAGRVLRVIDVLRRHDTLAAGARIWLDSCGQLACKAADAGEESVLTKLEAGLAALAKAIGDGASAFVSSVLERRGAALWPRVPTLGADAAIEFAFGDAP